MAKPTSTVSAPGGRGRRARRALYRGLADQLAGLIGSGALRPGDRLPSVREMSRERRVSIATVLAAYRLLEDRRLLEPRPQSGHFVSAAPAALPPRPAIRIAPSRRSDVRLADLISEMQERVNDPTLAPFGVATADPSLFPGRKLNAALSRLARDPERLGIEYCPPGGQEAMIHQVVRRAVRQGIAADPGEVVITNGCTEAVFLALRAVTSPGDTLLVESPTYPGFLAHAEALGLHVAEVTTCTELGLEPDQLAAAIRRTRPAALALTATCHNPLGVSVPESARAELVALCARAGVAIVEDAVYADLHFERAPRPLRAFDEGGTVLHCGSVSKTLTAGYRIGWVLAGARAARVRSLKAATSYQTNSLGQLAVAEFMGGRQMDAHLRQLRERLRCQVGDYAMAIGRHFPGDVRVSRPSGGHLLWVELSDGVDTRQLCRRALAAGIGIMPGELFSPSGTYRHCFRFNAGYPMTEERESAVARLGRLAVG